MTMAETGSEPASRTGEPAAGVGTHAIARRRIGYGILDFLGACRRSSPRPCTGTGRPARDDWPGRPRTNLHALDGFRRGQARPGPASALRRIASTRTRHHPESARQRGPGEDLVSVLV